MERERGIRTHSEFERRTHHEGSKGDLESDYNERLVAEWQAWKPQIRMRTSTIPRDLMAEPADMFLKRILELVSAMGRKQTLR